MMRARTRAPAFPPAKENPPVVAGKAAAPEAVGSPQPEEVEWEMRPGGMLVQKRTDADAGPPAPTLRVRVKYGAAYHEIYLSSQATFGELKKLLSARTGLHPQDQKLLFKDKERESSAYLDTSGVKDRSKIVLVEDPAGQARRFLELRKNAKMEKAAKSISQISLEVDKLATKVSALETIVSKGKKVAEGDMISLIEELMNQLLKLDGVIADGDVKLQRRIQVRRVQRYVETLDALKIKNSMPRTDTVEMAQQQQKQQQQQRENHVRLPPQKQYNHLQHQQQHQQHQQRVSQPGVVVTTNWETFDLLSGPPPATPSPLATSIAAAPATAHTPTNATSASITPGPRFEWELF